ncbi:hypothetical protein Q4S45_15825 [Massilia sp. R2A-15]|uniref:hypothetical protein n=1 Tax=Massilia sp. R2A-15 TaxID=3064278 RepID=UPI002736D040|nr:hypothetical protein [Massilia sp. R2A-15]WLI88196.1 hypothetical protein Q4S45_15825 [Massilia sp. R2A-15]
MRRFAQAAALAALLCAGPACATSQVFLVQNSGWMEPFYTDPQSQYKPLVTALASAVAQPGDLLVLASFNQSLPGAPSPKALLSSKAGASTRAEIGAALAGVQTAQKPGSSALADTDLGEAVNAAIHTALAGKPGLVWLFTNNRNSPNNDQATARRNREFYELIHSGGAITKALAFPLKMPVKGTHYSASGLMVYVFAIGEQGARDLDRLLASGRIAGVITEPPARLKPLDRDTVRLVPRRVSDAPGVAFSMGPGGMLRADVESDARTPAANIVWNLENTMYPYTIVSARIGARSVLAAQDRPIALASDSVSALAPGKTEPLSSVMQLPVAQLPSKWSAQAIASAGSAYVMPGRIELSLADQRLELSQAFRQRMEALFPGDPLPDIFTPPARIHGSTAVLPIEVRVHYGIAPLAALIGAGLALVSALGAAALAYGRPRRTWVTVEDEPRTVHTRAGVTQPIFDKAGNKVAQLKTTLFGHQLIDLREGAQVRLGR